MGDKTCFIIVRCVSCLMYLLHSSQIFLLLFVVWFCLYLFISYCFWPNSDFLPILWMHILSLASGLSPVCLLLPGRQLYPASAACIPSTLEAWALVTPPPGSPSSFSFFTAPAGLDGSHVHPQPAELPSAWSFIPLCCCLYLFPSSQNCLLLEGRNHALFICLFLVSSEFCGMDEYINGIFNVCCMFQRTQYKAHSGLWIETKITNWVLKLCILSWLQQPFPSPRDSIFWFQGVHSYKCVWKTVCLGPKVSVSNVFLIHYVKELFPFGL